MPYVNTLSMIINVISDSKKQLLIRFLREKMAK